jgi:DNA primase
VTVSQDIKSQLDIVDVVSEHVQLRKSGNSYSGFCPFHSNSRTPAFVVFPHSQTWRCFGACADGGDIFAFVMKKEGVDFKEAMAHLAQRAGVSLESYDHRDKVQQAEDEKLGDLLSAAADYFHQLFLYAPQADFARRYVAERGLTEQTISDFQIGFALNSWDGCRNHFTMQGYTIEDLLDAGLLTENQEKGSRYDRFRNRLMIPIRDSNGRTVGFGARTLDPDGLPKYLNSPQTTLFDKSRLLYGLDMAKRHIREGRQAVIVEGYMDVIQAWQGGYHNVVAQMGTALTEQQLTLLKRYTKRFVLALDADAAGAKATLRSLEVARETLDREAEAGFDARGLVRHEGRLEADIRVVTLPEGHDPDKLIRTNPTLWPQLVAQAKPVVEYVIGVVTAGLDINDAKAKTAAAQQVLPLIADVVDPIEREHYRQLLARTLRVDERALSHAVSTPVRRLKEQTAAPEKVTVKKPPAVMGRNVSTSLREANYLRQCLGYLRLVDQVDQKLMLHKQPVVTEADFATAEDRALLRFLKRQASRGTVAAVEELWDSLDETLRERAQSLLETPAAPESELERLPDLLVLSILDWRLEKVKGLLADVKLLFKEAQQEQTPDVIELYYQQLRELPLTVLSLNKAKWAMSAVSRRRTEDAPSPVK